LAGCMKRSQPWYAQARHHALAEDDRPTLSALNHNLAWHRALHAVQASLWGEGHEAEARHALTSAEATLQFDTCRGVLTLPSSIQVARALAYSVLGDYPQALAIYEAHAPQADAQGLLPLRPVILADMAWCCHHLGHQHLAHHYVQASVAALGLGRHADDLALAHGRLAQVLRRLEQPKRAASHTRRGRLNLLAHRRVQSQVLVLLERIDSALGLSVAASHWGFRYFDLPVLGALKKIVDATLELFCKIRHVGARPLVNRLAPQEAFDECWRFG
jgi:hypothetical protein